MSAEEGSASGSPEAVRTALGSWRPRLPAPVLRAVRWLTPLRALFFVLFALGLAGSFALGSAGALVSLPQLLLFPAVAGSTDAVISWYKSARWRFPWSGAVTGLFVALLLPPQGLTLPGAPPLLLDGSVLGAVAIVGKHVLRYRGRPWFNPAAAAVVLGFMFFGFTPAWWGTASIPAFVVGAAALTLVNWRRWILPLSCLVTFGVAVTVQRALTLSAQGLPIPSGVLLGEILDPATLFFVLFMVVEPRSAPSNPRLLPLYGATVGFSAVILSFDLPEFGAGVWLAGIGLLLALLVGNVMALAMRGVAAVHEASTPRSDAPSARRGRRRGRPTRVPLTGRPWGWVPRIVASVAALVLLGAAVSATPPAPSFSTAGEHFAPLTCSSDNQSIPASDLSMLHQRLGPSVIFWYDPVDGYTVFYDPVHLVTVYETDLFEDYGSAEWNGDDMIIAHGCDPVTGPLTSSGFGS
jgi:Na+-translocating ferredoxin:NAD+ oxidoreductase RnfD subunit